MTIVFIYLIYEILVSFPSESSGEETYLDNSLTALTPLVTSLKDFQKVWSESKLKYGASVAFRVVETR